MPRKISAGLLPYREHDGVLEVFLVHPGGPFWTRRDDAAWSIAKGEVDEGEDLEVAARRELAEETGWVAPRDLLPLGALRQPSGKVIHAWAFRGDFDPSTLRSNVFEMEWPRGS